MTYASVEDLQDRMTRELSDTEEDVAEKLLDDVSVIIDSYNSEASADVKKVVACRVVIRALGDGETSVPMGASQGSMSGLGYSQSWTFSSGGAVGELYLNKTEKKLLGVSKIGSHSPLEDCNGRNESYS